MDIANQNPIAELINDDNYTHIKSGLMSRSRWKIIGDVCETIGHILIGIAAILAFTVSIFDISYLSFISGFTSGLSVVLLKFSSYAMKFSKEQTDVVNLILTKLDLETIVDISSEPHIKEINRQLNISELKPKHNSNSNSFDEKIIELIYEDNYSNIKFGLMGRFCWKITGDVCETIGHILVGIATIFSFATGISGSISTNEVIIPNQFQTISTAQYLSFVAGCISTGSVVILKFSSYATRESKERTDEINRILTKMGLDTIVDISSEISMKQPINTDPITI